MTNTSIKKMFRPERVIALGFLAAILVGALLLCLPQAAADGKSTPFIDALFTATTSICVTGLVTVTTASHWSVLGKVIITGLIQLGGLGVISFMTVCFVLIRKRLTLSQRHLIQTTYNLDHMKGVVKLVKRIVAGTLIVEGVGALSYATVFIPEFGFWKGLGISVFNSVSGFCNAGMDIIGPDSLAPYISNPVINITTMLLIILGGIGFFVWWDVIKVGKMAVRGKIRIRDTWEKLDIQSKMALSITLMLIFGGAFLILCFDYNHAGSLGSLSAGDKVMAALFQSVTTRTAGFQTIAQDGFTDASAHISVILMFIGGSPLGTAGGMKTTTVGLAMLLLFAFMQGKEEIVIYNRKISMHNVRTAFTVIVMGLIVTLTGVLLLSLTASVDYLDAIYEIVSAVATVGLTRGITPSLPSVSKLVVITVMYLGRIAPITLALALTRRNRHRKIHVRYPEKNLIIG